MKTCRKCNLSKPLEEFVKDKTFKTGYTNMCLLCHKERCSQYNASHREERQSYRKQYYCLNSTSIRNRHRFLLPSQRESKRESARLIGMKPVHPGEILKYDHLEPLGISITAAADHLGISRKTLSKIVNGHGAVTTDMALRLSRAFRTSPELWMNLQRNYDIWIANHELKDWRKVSPYSTRINHASAAC